MIGAWWDVYRKLEIKIKEVRLGEQKRGRERWTLSNAENVLCVVNAVFICM
jgi:hypothetical protein